jgi:hypothetical protein
MTKLRSEQTGIALTSVVIVSFIMMLLVGSTVSFAVNSLDLSRRDQDWNAAMAAAEAGIDDYLYRLNRIDAYWQYSSANPAPDGNQAFTRWVSVPGAPNDARFRYTVDARTFLTDGTVKIASTGMVRGVTRTVYATVRRRNFLDYLYFTEYETKDPAIYNTGAPDNDPFTPAVAQQQCARHYYDTPARNPNCVSISFFSRDVIRGPLHSNDAIRISGNPQFLGDTSTSWNPSSLPRWLGTGSPTFVKAGDPRYLPPLTIPPSNVSIKNQTNPTLGGTGCLFTGPTRITLNSSGTMNVTSPLTRSGNCPTGNNRPLPANGVIYVQGVPASTSDPNYSACPATHPLRQPRSGWVIPSNDITLYGNCAGDAFVSGTLKGRLTIASANNIIVVGNTTYATGINGTDILGLVADNYVEIFHPVSCTSTTGNPPRCTAWADITPTFNNATVHAAILSVNHSFRVQNYRLGSPKGDLSIFGAIAQRYRGIVGTFSGNNVVTGYEKDYVYDQRLKYQSPPHFLDPVKSAWGIATWAEVKPCYPDTTGAVRNQEPCKLP